MENGNGNGNGKKKWVMGGVLVAAMGMAVTWSSGYVTAAKNGAAHTERVDQFMLNNAGNRDAIIDLNLRTALHQAAHDDFERRFHDLAKSQQMTDETVRRLADQVALLVQERMREGKIPR